MPLFKIAMLAIRLFIYCFIVIGALDEITSREYTAQILYRILEPLPVWLFTIANAIDTHWLQCAVLIVFLQSWHRKKDHVELMKTSNYTKMFIATMMTYFRVQVETKEVVALQKGEGFMHFKKTFKQGIALFLLGGEQPDSLLDSYPVRKGTRVTFEEDMKELLKTPPK
jgi:hypothetical protein